jgi:hypothetical protein
MRLHFLGIYLIGFFFHATKEQKMVVNVMSVGMKLEQNYPLSVPVIVFYRAK